MKSSLGSSLEAPLTICLIIHLDVINLNAKQWKKSDKRWLLKLFSSLLSLWIINGFVYVSSAKSFYIFFAFQLHEAKEIYLNLRRLWSWGFRDDKRDEKLINFLLSIVFVCPRIGRKGSEGVEGRKLASLSTHLPSTCCARWAHPCDWKIIIFQCFGCVWKDEERELRAAQSQTHLMNHKLSILLSLSTNLIGTEK